MTPRIGAFISIPKNASKSVLKILSLGENRDIDDTQSPVIYENHQRGSILASRYNLDDLFVFCFSRNPFDRCISWYEYHRHIDPYRKMSFREWVNNGLPHHFTKQNLTDYISLNITPLSQSAYVDGCKVDFVGKLETFAEDMRHVIAILNARSTQLGLETKFSYYDLRTNISRRRHILEYYNEDARQMVYRLLVDDFDRFGYTADLNPQGGTSSAT